MQLLKDETRRTALIIVILLGAMLPAVFAAAKPAAQATPTPAAHPLATPGAIASPEATPVAECGSDASSPTEIAEVFVAAATAQDLERAARCFAPDRQPASWDDVYLVGPADEVSGCRGMPYIVIETKLRSDLSAIIFIFERPCAIATLDEWQRDLYDADTLTVPMLVVQVHQRDGRWYVQDAFVSVPD